MSVNHGANLFDLSENLGLSRDSLMDFSSNINPFGSSEKAKKAVITNIDMVSIYPDPNYKKLKKSIGDYCSCSPNNMILGSGATELISSFIKLISPKNSMLLSPSYSEYEKELNKANCSTIKYFSKKENNFTVDIKDFINNINESKVDLVIICNPNNPTGFAFKKDEIQEILENTNCFIMVDETYVEFTNMDIFSSTSLIDNFSKLFVIRGTSKFFSTPGIRLGYALSSHEEILKGLSNTLDLWNINIFATLMGEAMFSDSEYIEKMSRLLSKERNFLLKNLELLNNIKVYNSFGNFILCEIENKKITAKKLYDILLKKGIIIRNCESFPSLGHYFFRVCILKPEENKILIEELKQLF